MSGTTGYDYAVMKMPEAVGEQARNALATIDKALREASLALGASRWRTVWCVVLPTARPGLATAVILGVARGVGETSPVLLTSGAASFLVTNPTSGAMNSLPLYIYSTVRSGEPQAITRAFGKLHADGTLWQDKDGRMCVRGSAFAAKPPG